MSTRFTVLLHEPAAGTPNPAHWDILLEPAAGAPALLTWSIPPQRWEVEESFRARGIRLPDHRRVYLDYEGEVAGHRGHVRRLDTGTCDILGPGRFRLSGSFFNGELTVRSFAGSADDVELTYTALDP